MDNEARNKNVTEVLTMGKRQIITACLIAQRVVDQELVRCLQRHPAPALLLRFSIMVSFTLIPDHEVWEKQHPKLYEVPMKLRHRPPLHALPIPAHSLPRPHFRLCCLNLHGSQILGFSGLDCHYLFIITQVKSGRSAWMMRGIPACITKEDIRFPAQVPNPQ